MIDGEPIKWLGGEFYFDFQTRESRLEPMEQHLSHLAGKENLKILEIGSCEGQSTLWFIKKLLTCILGSMQCVMEEEVLKLIQLQFV